jgi:hypothetical protein
VAVLIVVVGAATPAVAQDRWIIRLGAAALFPDGESAETRSNGTVATTDIDKGYAFTIRLERRLSSRVGVELGALGYSIHHLTLHQAFPDGTDFESNDSFRFQSLMAGVVLRPIIGGRVDLIVEPFVHYAMFDDLFIESAGPPFDRAFPREVDVERKPGAGMLAALEIAAGRMTFGPWLAFALTPFHGTYAPEPSGVNGGEIRANFNPLMAGVGMGFKL